MNWLIFTDLDGSLLDHHTYAWQAAKPLLHKLEEQGIKVIANTSKTHAELLSLTLEIPLAREHIVENGAGIFLPKADYSPEQDWLDFDRNYYLKPCAREISPWYPVIEKVCERFDDVLPLHQMTEEDITAATGLDRTQAAFAKTRLFSDPVQCPMPQRKTLIAALKTEGCHVIEGGRFVHVSDNCNKGTALRSLTGYLSNKENKPFRTLAIGDGKNDIAMLEAADVALLIPSPVQPFPIIKKDRHLYHAQAFAADGWQEGVTRILQNTET